MAKKRGGYIDESPPNIIVTIFFVVLMIVGGMYLIMNADKKHAGVQTTATVTSSSTCLLPQGTSKGPCRVINYEFTVNGTKYEKKNHRISGAYTIGSTLRIAYNESDPNQHTVNPPTDNKLLGWILIGLAIVIMVGTAFSMYS